MKKSSIAKFLLSTMFIPTALAGNCKADPVKLEVPYLMNVLKHLPSIDDRRKFIKASRNAGDAFYRNYLLDLTSFGTDYNHLDDNTKRLLIRNLIKDYCGKYGDSEDNCTDEVKGTVAISYGNFRDTSTVPIMIEELLNEEVVKKLKNRIGVVYIDKFYPNFKALKTLFEKYPDAKLFMHKIKYCKELNELDKDKWYRWGFDILEVDVCTNFKGLNQFLSQFNNQKITLNISNWTSRVDVLGTLLQNHKEKINAVIFNNKMINPKCLKNISKKYFLQEKQTYSHHLNCVKEFNLGQTNICSSPMDLDSWDDFNGDYKQPTNVFELTYKILCIPLEEGCRYINREYSKLNELVNDPEVTNKEINEYFDNRKKNIEKIFDLEKHLFLFTAVISFMNEVGGDNEVQKTKLINEKLIQELEFISDKLEAKKGGEVKLKINLDAHLTEDFYNRLMQKNNISIYYIKKGKSIRTETFDEIKAAKEEWQRRSKILPRKEEQERIKRELLEVESKYW